MRIIITADEVIIPQDGFDRRPEFHDFLKLLLGSVQEEAARARQRYEELACEQPPMHIDDGDGGTLTALRLPAYLKLQL